MQLSRYAFVFAGALGAILSFPVVAQAQSEQSSAEGSQRQVVGEVVVTARRRSEDLQEVPISIVSKTGEYLQEAGVASITELERVVPGFIFNEFEAGQQSTAQLRGLSSFGYQTHAPQSVGV